MQYGAVQGRAGGGEKLANILPAPRTRAGYYMNHALHTDKHLRT